MKTLEERLQSLLRKYENQIQNMITPQGREFCKQVTRDIKRELGKEEEKKQTSLFN